MKAFSYDIKVEDSQYKYGNGNTGIIFAKTKESAEKKLAKKYCWRKTQEIINIELEEVTSGMFETWSYGFKKREVKQND